MKFVFPNVQHEQKARAFIGEFHAHGSNINGGGNLDTCLKDSSYADWLDKLARDIDLANIAPDRVPGLTYFYVREDDDKIVGMINIRLTLNDFLRREGGHIGYCIRPTERSKGYATQMLLGSLAFCRVLGLHDFVLTCDKENAASARVIQKCGGVLQSEFYSEFFREIVQRYIIA